jgi:hypothetical protein
MSRGTGLAILAAAVLVGIAVLWVVLPAESSRRSVHTMEAAPLAAHGDASIAPSLESTSARSPAIVPAPAAVSPDVAPAPAPQEEALRIRGLVVNMRGAPLPRCRIWARDSDESATGASGGDAGKSPARDGIKADTDGTGRFVLEGLIASSYRLLAMDLNSLASAETDPIRPGAGEVRILIDTDDIYPCVAGQIVDYAGQPVTNMRVIVTRNSPDGGMMCGEVRTDVGGNFHLEDVPRSADSIAVLPERAVSRPFPLRGVSDLCSLRLELPGSGDVRVVVETPDVAADEFAVLDAQGRRIQLAVHWHGGWAGPNETLPVGEGQWAIVSEDAATLVLLMKGQEIRRVPMRVSPGEQQVIRL